MKSNLKIILKIILMTMIILNLPLHKVITETTASESEEVVAQSNGKSIYIYNTHQSEKYATNSVKEGSQYLMQLLQQKGYSVEYETTDFELYKTNNNIDYSYSYTVSKKYLNIALSNHGSYDLVIDFHRDSIDKSLSTLITNNKSYAKLMFVVGKGSENYEAVNTRCETLSDMLNNKVDGLCRGVYLKKNDYNQGVTDNMLLIEVGANENTYEEVQNSLQILAVVIDEYLKS